MSFPITMTAHEFLLQRRLIEAKEHLDEAEAEFRRQHCDDFAAAFDEMRDYLELVWSER